MTIKDPTTLAAARLHDTIEDTNTTARELRRHFGPLVAGIVAEVTDDKTLPKAERKRQQVAHAAHLSRRARLVKLADKISNLEDLLKSPPAGWSLERKREYFDWARQVVNGMRGTHVALERRFDRVYRGRP